MSSTKNEASKRVPAKRRAVNGEGTVYARPNGKFQTQVTVGADSKGKPIRRTITADSEPEARRARIKMLSQNNDGLLAPPGRVTVEQLCRAVI